MDLLVRILNGALMILLPLALGLALAHRTRAGWRLFAIGAVTFVASQLLHIPFNAWALNPWLDSLGEGGLSGGPSLFLAGLALGLSAGIFEEGFRYLAYRYWAKEARSWESGLMLGAGHGGIEAILLGSLALLGLVQVLVLQRVDLAEVIPADQLELAQAQIQAYWAVPWYEALLGAVERVFALVTHLTLSLLVMQVFLRGQWYWLAAAIGWHTLVNAAAVIAVQRWGFLAAEAVLLPFALAGAALIWWLRAPSDPERPEEEPAAPAPPPHQNPPVADAGRLEDTRYQAPED